jgi:hypothetical protein
VEGWCTTIQTGNVGGDHRLDRDPSCL